MGCSFKSLDLLFPRLCLQCEAKLSNTQTLFCTECLGQLSLIERQERCPCCFAETSGVCTRCRTRRVVIKRQTAACPRFGPAYTLLSYLKKGHIQWLSSAVSLMVLQWATLKWQRPDLIVPLPFSHFAPHERELSLLLARQIAQLIDCPWAPLLRASFDGRAFLEKGVFQSRYSLRRRHGVFPDGKQRLMLVALELSDEKLRAAAEALQHGFPQEICALAFVAE